MIAIIYDHALDRFDSHRSKEAYAAPCDTARAVQEALAHRGISSEIICFNGCLQELHRTLRNTGIRLIFNLCEAGWGDNRHEATLALCFEELQLPYTGCQPLALALAVDKQVTQRILKEASILTPTCRVVQLGEEFVEISSGLRFPLIVKPNYEDGSVGIENNSVIFSQDSLRRKVRDCLSRFGTVLIQEYIEGRELSVSILGSQFLEVFPLSEITIEPSVEKHPGTRGPLTYQAKWARESEDWARTSVTLFPRLNADVENRMRELAQSAYRLIGCDGYARLDFRLNKDGIPYLLEINPNPAIGPEDGFVRAAREGGYTYGDLLAKILTLAEQRWDRRKQPSHNGAQEK